MLKWKTDFLIFILEWLYWLACLSNALLCQYFCLKMFKNIYAAFYYIYQEIKQELKEEEESHCVDIKVDEKAKIHFESTVFSSFLGRKTSWNIDEENLKVIFNKRTGS